MSARWSGQRRGLRIRDLLTLSQPDATVTHRPAVAVTATTEIIRGVDRVRANVSYTDALDSAGLRPYILPVLSPEAADGLLEGMDGLLLTGGEDIDPSHYGEASSPLLGDVHAARDSFEIALVLAARARRLPTLAICRGVQVANVALGGTLVQDLPSERPGNVAHDGSWPRSSRVHAVTAVSGSGIARALGADRLTVNSFHHQSVDRLGEGLMVSARADDGVIEGVEWTADDWWLLGAQWHPEELTRDAQPWDRALFAAFADAARARVGISR